MRRIRIGLSTIVGVLFALGSPGCLGGGGGGGGGGGVGVESGCSSYCTKYVGQCDSTLTQEQCVANCQNGFPVVPGCESVAGALSQCMGAAPVDCTAGFPYECQNQLSALYDCISCPPTTGGAQPGQVCSAADEGKEQCWGCKAVLDCRYEDGHFLWRINQDCEASGGTCSESSTYSGSYSCY